jgi:signal peptidase I
VENFLNLLKKFWKFLWYDDSLLSYIASLLVAFIFIKFIFFPGIGLIFGTNYPIVAIVSGSMEHRIEGGQICNSFIKDNSNGFLRFDDYWNFCGDWYEKNTNITKTEFESFPWGKTGLNIGDVIIVKGEDPKDIKVGDILIFIPEDRKFFEEKGPVIHRVIKKWKEADGWHFQTKGDHNPVSYQNFESNIPEKNILGVGFIRIPFLGYPKIMLYKIYENLLHH